MIFKITFVVLWIIYIAIRVPFDKTYKQTEKSKKVNGPVEKFLLIFLSIGLMIIPLLWAFTPFLNQFELHFPFAVRLVGIAIAIISLIYFRQIHKELGANWSPTLEIRKDHELIKTGPYKRIRHPMYAQIWLWTIAQILIVSNLIAGFSGVIVWSILSFIRIRNEEKMLVENFGDKYIEYRKQTGSVLPKISRDKAPRTRWR